MRHLFPGRASLEDAVVRICCTAAVLALMLVALRTRILFGWSDLRAPSRLLPGLALGAFGDLGYAAGLAAAFVLLLAGTRKLAWVRGSTVRLFAGLASLSLLLGFVNVRAIAELGHPINYQWLYYSNFMRSLDSYTALAALVSWRWIGVVLVSCLALLVLAHVLVLATRRALATAWGRFACTIVLSAFAAYLGIGWLRQRAAGSTSPKMQNAVVALVASVLDADDNPVLAKMPTRFGPDDFLTAGERQGTVTRTPYTALARRAGVSNVIVVVLESVGAEYLWGFGVADSGGTPELDRYRRSTRRFTSFYAHQPSSTHSLVSLLLGIYSPNSFRVVTREHPDIALPSLSGELKRQGYRTALISGPSLRFQSVDVFLSHQHFDLLTDSRDACASRTTHPDDCMVRDLLTWVDRRGGEPFFALLWTVQTHWPYIAPQRSPANGKTDSSSVRLARYVGALRETDRALGVLLRSLQARGILDSTLVVVTGDHGEAFGQHDNAFHRLLYEEEVRVPLLLINSKLFHGERDTVSGGLIDIAPTVLDLLGITLPVEWHGRSLFDPGRPDRVYLFGPYSGLFGLRDGSLKIIYDPIANENRLYDLSTDPHERVNLAASRPGAVQQARERLAAWVQYLERFYLRLGVTR